MLCLTLKQRELLQIHDLTLSIETDKDGRYKLRIDGPRTTVVRRLKRFRGEPAGEGEQGENSTGNKGRTEGEQPPISSSTHEILRRMMAANKRK